MLKLCTIILLLMLSSCNANKDADKESVAEGVDGNRDNSRPHLQ
jgi:hypothetical protein